MPPFRLVAKLLRLTVAAATAPDARAEVGAAADPPAPSPRAESRADEAAPAEGLAGVDGLLC